MRNEDRGELDISSPYSHTASGCCSENADPLFPDLLSFQERLDASMKSPDFQMLETNSIFYAVQEKKKTHKHH